MPDPARGRKPSNGQKPSNARKVHLRTQSDASRMSYVRHWLQTINSGHGGSILPRSLTSLYDQGSEATGVRCISSVSSGPRGRIPLTESNTQLPGVQSKLFLDPSQE